jgi:hypothetical protein
MWIALKLPGICLSPWLLWLHAMKVSVPKLLQCNEFFWKSNGMCSFVGYITTFQVDWLQQRVEYHENKRIIFWKAFRKKWSPLHISTSPKFDWNERKKPRKSSVWAAGGRAAARAVSRWLPTAASRVRFRACGGQSGTKARFLRVLRFPLPIVIPKMSLSS